MLVRRRVPETTSLNKAWEEVLHVLYGKKVNHGHKNTMAGGYLGGIECSHWRLVRLTVSSSLQQMLTDCETTQKQQITGPRRQGVCDWSWIRDANRKPCLCDRAWQHKGRDSSSVELMWPHHNSWWFGLVVALSECCIGRGGGGCLAQGLGGRGGGGEAQGCCLFTLFAFVSFGWGRATAPIGAPTRGGWSWKVVVRGRQGRSPSTGDPSAHSLPPGTESARGGSGTAAGQGYGGGPRGAGKVKGSPEEGPPQGHPSPRTGECH